MPTEKSHLANTPLKAIESATSLEASVFCSHCGMDIPFAGKVCPYCKADKAKGQEVLIAAFTFGFLGTFLGWLFTQGLGLPEHLGAIILGAIVGGVIGVMLLWSGTLDRSSE